MLVNQQCVVRVNVERREEEKVNVVEYKSSYKWDSQDDVESSWLVLARTVVEERERMRGHTHTS